MRLLKGDATMNRPNIVVFMTDQQNASTIRNSSQAIMPNVRNFLEEAMLFEESYCPAPHCCPSRASFFTGLFPAEHGVWNNVLVDNAISRTVFDNVMMFPEELKKAGYTNLFAGKWHVSAYEGPLDRGFDKLAQPHMNYTFFPKDNVPRAKEWERVFDKETIYDKKDDEKTFGRIIREGYQKYVHFGVSDNPYNDNDRIDSAIKTLESYDSEDPFFMFIGAVGPHDPYNPPQRFLDMYKDMEIELPPNFHDDMKDKPALYRRTQERFDLTEEEHKESIRRYLAYCTYEDSLFKQVLDTIDNKGIRDNTIIMYLTDHGDYMGAHGLWTKGLPCFREAYNICSAVSGPGIKSGICRELISLADFAPTILELAGYESDIEFTGKSLVPFLKGETPNGWRTEIFTQTNGNEIYGIQRAVWNKNYKYVFNAFDYDELYDLENDPYELKNIINDKSKKEVVKEMCKKMWQFAYETKDAATCSYITISLAPYGPAIINE